MKAALRRLIPVLCLAWFASCLPRQLAVFLGDVNNPLWWSRHWNQGNDQYGQALAYGTPTQDVSYNMPLTGTLAELARRNPGARGEAFVLAVWLAPALLAFAVADSLAGAEAGWLAAALAASFDLRDPLHVWNPATVVRDLTFETALYACLLTCVAAALARSEEPPSRRDSAWVGLTIGLSLLSRSPLFLFPGALLAYDWSRRGRETVSSFWLRRFPILAAPALMLAPWVYMNWETHGRFIPLENGRQYANLLTGAAGHLGTVQIGTYFRALGLAGAAAHPYRLAAFWVLSHPLRYALSVCERILYVFSLHPLLWTASLWALWRGRGSPATRRLGLLAFYFVGVHCLMSVEPRYFLPLLPLLAILTAVAAAGLLGLARPRPAWSGLLDSLFWVEALPLAFAGAWSLCLVATYPARLHAYARDPGALTRAGPADAWPWVVEGARLEARQDVCGAAGSYAQALARLPTPENLANYQRASRAMLDNRLLVIPPTADGGSRPKAFSLVSQQALLALEFLGQGNDGAARAALETLKRQWREPACRPHNVIFEAVPTRELSSLASPASLKELARLLEDWPRRDRLVLLKRLESYAGRA